MIEILRLWVASGNVTAFRARLGADVVDALPYSYRHPRRGYTRLALLASPSDGRPDDRHEICTTTRCTLCLQPVPCDEYLANDHVCSPCGAKAGERHPDAVTSGGFFPEQGQGRAA